MGLGEQGHRAGSGTEPRAKTTFVHCGRRTFKIRCQRSHLVFNCCFYDTGISQGNVATYLRCGGIYSDSIITNVLSILTVK